MNSNIRKIIANRHGRAGHNGSWQVDILIRTPPVYQLWHYTTLMLSWYDKSDGTSVMIGFSLGHGSVSDQGGMNIAFRELGLSYRYDRDYRGGGPRISALEHPFRRLRYHTTVIVDAGNGARLEDILDEDIMANVKKIIERGKR